MRSIEEETVEAEAVFKWDLLKKKLLKQLKKKLLKKQTLSKKNVNKRIRVYIFHWHHIENQKTAVRKVYVWKLHTFFVIQVILNLSWMFSLLTSSSIIIIMPLSIQVLLGGLYQSPSFSNKLYPMARIWEHKKLQKEENPGRIK